MEIELLKGACAEVDLSAPLYLHQLNSPSKCSMES